MRKVKLFAADMYFNDGDTKRPGIGEVRDNLQKEVDNWCNKNPTFIIENTSISLTKEEALMSVVYTIESPPFGQIK